MATSRNNAVRAGSVSDGLCSPSLTLPARTALSLLLRGRLLLGGRLLGRGLLRRLRAARLLAEDRLVARRELAVLGQTLTNDAHGFLRVVNGVWAYADQCNPRPAGCHFPEAKR